MAVHWRWKRKGAELVAETASLTVNRHQNQNQARSAVVEAGNFGWKEMLAMEKDRGATERFGEEKKRGE